MIVSNGILSMGRADYWRKQNSKLSVSLGEGKKKCLVAHLHAIQHNIYMRYIPTISLSHFISLPIDLYCYFSSLLYWAKTCNKHPTLYVHDVISKQNNKTYMLLWISLLLCSFLQYEGAVICV